MSSFVVREVEERDLEALLGLYRQLAEGDAARMPGGTEASRNVLGQILADPARHVCIATLDAKLVGSAEVTVLANLTHGARPWAVIENVIVDESVRGRGAGTALLEHTAQTARTAGCYKVQLHSGKQRADAHRLYQRLGFQPVAEGFKMYFVETASNLRQ